MKTIKKIVSQGPEAEAAGKLVEGRSPSTVAENESVGHIVITRHTEI